MLTQEKIIVDSKWFKIRNLKILNYQQNTIIKVLESIEQREITILAACPSAGKTLMSINIIEKYLAQNPNHKVLILTHGTTILRTQFHDVLEEIMPNFTYNLVEKFNQYDVMADVNVCLPQTLVGNKLNEINLLIVDEAHQFYFGEKMVKEIIEKTNPRKQLLLTGTPSTFIGRGFNIIPTSLNTIFDEGMISDLYVEIATSSYSFDPMNDFNDDDELKASIYIKESETKKTLDDLIGKIVNRLKSIKGNHYQNLLPEWLPALKKLQKTMFACRSQQQAMQVHNYFEKIGVKSALSISNTDKDSLEIERFKNESDCLILIVVARGILGFNYPGLVNVVDMTASQNIDRIYQLLCRVIRIHPEGHKKLFFKIAPNIHSDYYKYIMTAVLSLFDESFLTTFNGKNFSDMLIPVIKTKRERHERNNNGNRKPKTKTLMPIDFEGLPVFEFFKDLYHKKDALLHVYTYTTVRDVRAEFSKQMPKGYWTKEKCKASALRFDTRGDWQNNDNGAYKFALKNGWLDECCAHMETKWQKRWNKENCIVSALQFETRSDWNKNESGAYSAAMKNGWLDECCAHMKIKNSYTKEGCIEGALQFETRGDWRRNDNGAYDAAWRNGWLVECCAHMEIKKRNPWNKESCIKSASQFETRGDWSKNENSAYNVAWRNGWLDECCAHMKIMKKSHTKESCIGSALQFETRGDWSKNDNSAYNVALKNGWFDECSKHMEIMRKSWNKENCIESAQQFESKKDWQKNESGAYYAALKNGWSDECCAHMKNGRKTNNYWNKENCIESAQQFESKKDWQKNESGAYTIAWRNGWLDECCAHMKIMKKSHTKESCMESASKHKRSTDWESNDRCAYQAAVGNGWLTECCAHMKITKQK